MGYQQATLKEGRMGCRLFLLGDNTRDRPAHQTIWLSRSVELLARSTFSIRLAPAKNDPQIKVHPWQVYTDFKRALRGHTQPTLLSIDRDG